MNVVGNTLFLVRHAQTQEQEGTPRRLSGWHDVGLSSAGRSQAALLARRLRHEYVDAIYSSPLLRAADTAREIAKHTALPVAYSAMLKEINCGEVEGELLDDVRRRYPEHWERNLRQQDANFRWPGGESYAEFRDRCLSGIEQLAKKHSMQRVAIVTHAGVISQILGHMHCVSPARWESFRPGPASISVIRWHDGAATLVAFDDRAHLQSEDAATRKEHQP